MGSNNTLDICVLPWFVFRYYCFFSFSHRGEFALDVSPLSFLLFVVAMFSMFASTDLFFVGCAVAAVAVGK